MLEQLFNEQTQESSEHQERKTTRNKRRKTDSAVTAALTDNEDEDDVYYASVGKKVKGIGYAGDVKEDVSASLFNSLVIISCFLQTSGQQETQAIQNAKDKKIAYLLAEIRTYLPSLHRPGGGETSDYLVHPTALAHLRRRFNYVCSSLLRNDSLTDMSDRSVLYFELLEWLEVLVLFNIHDHVQC